MAHDGTRGKIYDPDGNDTFDMGVLTDEDVSLSGGLFRQQIPLLGADSNIFEAVFGKVRIIRLNGFKYGTQEQIENFIEQFTDVIDVQGLNETLRYYPLFHQKNTLYATNKQDKYYIVLFNDFSYRVSVDDAGFILFYDIELFEGVRVLGS